jgi:hypothetical protein
MPTRSSSTPAIAAHTIKISNAHELGTVMAETPLPAGAECEATPRTGNAAIASKAENHTANRVLEFRWPTTRSRIQAKSPIAMPSSMQFTRLWVDIRTSWFRVNGVIIYLFIPVWLCLFQQLPQALQFLGVDAAILQNVEHQHFMRTFEKAIGQMTNF